MFNKKITENFLERFSNINFLVILPTTALYPRKEGKKQGIIKCKAQIKTEEDFQRLKTSVENYAKKCESEKIEKKFIKQFSSFMSCWEDYEEIEIAKSFEEILGDFFVEQTKLAGKEICNG